MKEQENEGMTEQGMRQRGPISWIMEVGWGRVGWGGGGVGGGQARVFFVNQSENWNHS